MHLRLSLLLAIVSLGWGQRLELKRARNLGALDASEAVEGISIHFTRTAAQQRDLDQFLVEVHRPGSANYHRWLSPEEYATRFGLNDADLARVETWLRGSGLRIDHRGRTRGYLMASGTAGGVKRAFGTELRRYEHRGQRHFASAGPVKIPAEVNSLVLNVDGLDDFLPEPAGNLTGGRHVLAPDDYAVIYNIRPSLQRGVDGTGQKIAVVGQSRIELSDMSLFRTRYNLPPNVPEVILYPGSRDPGFNDAQGEANLDLQWAGAIARNAKLFYVYGSSALSAAVYVIDQKLAPIVSVSFSAGCEAQHSQAVLFSARSLVQTANAMGITWVNSSGDSGPAGCDSNSSAIAQNGFGPRFPSVIPEITAVGGTELNDRNGDYWRGTNDANLASALSYIPETPWNESVAGVTVASGGGGISSFFLRPEWQSGPGVGNERFRKSPDIALSASGYIGYAVIQGGALTIYGGTSAGTPAFAGMLALVLQATNQTGLGNINRILYPLAQSSPDAFHDVSTGNTLVPCAAGTKDCTTGKFGFEATPGYDLATGLGSVDFDRLLAAWPRQQPAQSLVTFSNSNAPVYAASSGGNLSWTFALTLQEHAGLKTTVTSFKIDGEDLTSQVVNFFGSNTIPAGAKLNGGLAVRNLNVPLTRTFEITGRDESGHTWIQTLPVQFAGLPPAPTINGIANGASFGQSFAPGSILSIFGTNLATGTQAAAAVPLIDFSGGVMASVNGVNAPFYYVSQNQINLQIPYGTPVGTAQLTLGYPQAGSSTVNVPISETAPGIFTDGQSFTVPQNRCGRGETCILFITGQGAVNPGVATGAAPSPNLPVSALPRPIGAVSMTIGGVPAGIAFAGIPYGLTGVTQINFTVAAGTPVGTQQVVVKVGPNESAAAKIDVF